jgi:hypothetical protein
MNLQYMAAIITLFLMSIIPVVVYLALKRKNETDLERKPLSPIIIKSDHLVISKDNLPLEIIENLHIHSPVNKNALYENSLSEKRAGASQKSGEERRRKPRQPIQAVVDFISKGRLFKQNAENYSKSGIFLKFRNTDYFKPNQQLTLCFQTDQGTPYKYQGRIARIAPTGVGVEFINNVR